MLLDAFAAHHLTLVGLLLMLALLRVAGFELTRRALPDDAAGAWAVAGVIGLAAAAQLSLLAAWSSGSGLGPSAIVLGVAGLGAAAMVAARLPGARAPRPRLAEALPFHAVWLGAFAIAIAVVAHNPSVDPDSERFMDMAMTRAYLAQASMPVEDPWLSGEKISYYDGGYYLGAWLTRATGADLGSFFNVLVALVYASLAAGIFALGRALAGWTGAGLATFFIALGGPPRCLIEVVTTGSLDWFQAARSIPDTITEFPSFSLLWGDLHPYFMVLPLWAPCLFVAFAAARDVRALHRPWTVGLAALALGTVVWVHTWDAVPLGLALAGGAALGTGARWRPLARAAAGLGVAVAAALAIAWHYIARLPHGAGGFARVDVPSTLGDWCGLFGVPVLLVAAVGLVELRGSARAPLLLGAAVLPFAFLGWTPLALAAILAVFCALLAAREGGLKGLPWLLACVGFALLGVIEVVHLDDFYVAPLERMNTVFKVVMHAWLLLGLAAAAAASRLVAKVRWLGLATLALVVVPAGTYAVVAPGVRFRGVPAEPSLDTELALGRAYPDDLAAIRELRARFPRGRLVEWAGDPYTWSGRFATFTGWPGVVGWAHHEAGWRGDWEGPIQRRDAVRILYATHDVVGSRVVLEQLGVRYVVVGDIEREAIPDEESLRKFEQMGRPIVTAGRTIVYEIR